MKIWQIVAACSGLLWVVIGAATGHGMLHGEAAVWMEKAQRYHIVHTLALLWLASVGAQYAGAHIVAWLWLVGVVLFSGSLYVMSLAGSSPLRFIVPVGGVAILAAWAWLVIIIYQAKS